ncbi:hypothetical protein MAPG_04715 [Magnaporthiopsis poae ATCC 64411]|uniref:CFEM domain-containing protein n=1 Tax=Magnaporthiopsis poae (strain ATCC 64411 / 73-15) TaxID=644358 RepID=A0A0C4DXG2_MAGP6|nr:hypothetical protein MAPG_04715 [Magnaporthiopsis poae ATCC 64411]
MKYSTALAAFAAAGLASAQSLNDVPQCARQCLGPVIKETGCSETDVSCLCKAENRSKVISSGTACVVQSCGQETAINEVLPAITRICSGAGGNTLLPGTTRVSTTGAATGTTRSGSVPTTTVPTVTSTGTTSLPIGVPTTRPGGTNNTSSTSTSTSASTTGTALPAGAPKLTGLGGAAMMALAFFAAY